jgi:RNA polymerase sigma-70 factor (ECF subfamily)
MDRMHFDRPESRVVDPMLDTESDDVSRVLATSAAAGNEASLVSLLDLHSDRLSKLIALRIDRRMKQRIGVEDVMQEVHIRAARHLRDYLQHSTAPFYLWIRSVTVNVLLELHRRHLGTQMRDARREVALGNSEWLAPSSDVLAQRLADTGTSPSNVAMRAEVAAQLKNALDSLPPADQEVLALRHFEQLSPSETAQVLQLSEKASGMRYIRALKRLRSHLDGLPGGSSWWRP